MKKIILGNIFASAFLVISIGISVYCYVAIHSAAPQFYTDAPSEAKDTASFINVIIVAIAILINSIGFIFIKKEWAYRQFFFGLLVGGLITFFLLPMIEHSIAQKNNSAWYANKIQEDKTYDSLTQKINSGKENFEEMKYIGTPSKSRTGLYHIGDTVCGGIVINVIDDTSNAVVFYPDYNINEVTADGAFTTVAQTILFDALPIKGFWRLPRTDELQSIYNNPKLKKYLKNGVKNCWGIKDTYSIETGIFNFKNGQINFNPKPDETATTMLVYQF